MEYILHLIILIIIYTILAQSLSLASGFAGMISLAQAGFYGIGAYTSAILSVNYHFSFLLDAQLKVLQTKVSPINTNNAFILLSLFFIFAAIPAFYYSLYILGIIFLIIASCLFFGRRYVIKESSLGIIQEQLSNINAKENEVKNSYEEYLEKTLNLEKALSDKSYMGGLLSALVALFFY